VTVSVLGEPLFLRKVAYVAGAGGRDNNGTPDLIVFAADPVFVDMNALEDGGMIVAVDEAKSIRDCLRSNVPVPVVDVLAADVGRVTSAPEALEGGRFTEAVDVDVGM